MDAETRAALLALDDLVLYRLCAPALGLRVTYRDAVRWVAERLAEDRMDPLIPERVLRLRAALAEEREA